MKDALIVSALSLFPRKAGARGMGMFARTRVSRWVTRAFVSVYGVNLEEASGTLEDYPTLEALFTRTLKPGARPIDASPEAVVSPVDGKVAAIGRTTNGTIELVPGKTLSISALLDEPEQGEWDVAVLYLSPKDYHRVHVPREGNATSWSYLPGTLWPVFPAAVRQVQNLFSKNERVRVRIATDTGDLEVVLVGAFGVGRISIAMADLLTNTGGSAQQAQLQPPAPLARGDWLGTFHLGSTVILAARPGLLKWTIEAGANVRYGVPIGAMGGDC